MKLFFSLVLTAILTPFLRVDAEDFDETFKVKVGAQLCTCGATAKAVLPITLDSRKRKMVSVASLLKELQKKLPRTVTPKQAKLRANIARFKKIQRSCSTPCKQTGTELGLPKPGTDTPSEGSPKNTATPTPTSANGAPPTPTSVSTASPTPGERPTNTPTPKPTNTPTPTPTATPDDGGCFTASGDTNCFGIPANLTGNISSGSKVWSALSCSGCHSEVSKRNLGYSRVNAAFSNSAMAVLPKPSNQNIADITAYLNRYNR